MASTYENPQEVIDYYHSNQQQLAAVESKVLEDQVVEKLLAERQYHRKVSAVIRRLSIVSGLNPDNTLGHDGHHYSISNIL